MSAHRIPEAVRTLRDPATIRARARQITQHVLEDKSAYFRLELEKLPEIGAFVLKEVVHL
ncbi:MAG: hypothetical protein AAGJ35_02345 [Myxococcota bacterium]